MTRKERISFEQRYPLIAQWAQFTLHKVYDESMTISQALYNLRAIVIDIAIAFNELDNEWEEFQKEMTEYVTIEINNKLDLWLNDGTLESLINDKILNDILIDVKEMTKTVVSDNEVNEKNHIVFKTQYESNYENISKSNQQLISEFNETRTEDFENRVFRVSAFNINVKTSYRYSKFKVAKILAKVKNYFLQCNSDIISVNELAHGMEVTSDMFKVGRLKYLTTETTWKNILPGVNYGEGTLSHMQPISSRSGIFQFVSGDIEHQCWINNVYMITGFPVSHYTVHFNYLNETIIKRQAQELFNIISADTNKYIVVSGDFNFDLTKMKEVMPQFVGAGFKNANGGKFKTYNDIRNIGIDEVMVNSNIEIVDAFTIETDRNVTDHFIMNAVLKLKV